MNNQAQPILEVVVPVYNEQAALEQSVRTLHAYLSGAFDLPWLITIADNASTDATLEIATLLTYDLDRVGVLHLDEKGRGRALKRAWLESSARVVAYVDVDLSTDLRGLPPLVAPLLSGHSDIAIGTRLVTSSRVSRGGQREFISRSYNFLLRRVMGAQFTDAQCGFKAMRTDVAAKLLPLVEDTGWFFDTELLDAGRAQPGCASTRCPVDWVDDPDSRGSTSWPPPKADLKRDRPARHARAGQRRRIPLDLLCDELSRHAIRGPALRAPEALVAQLMQVRRRLACGQHRSPTLLLFVLFSAARCPRS